PQSAIRSLQSKRCVQHHRQMIVNLFLSASRQERENRAGWIQTKISTELLTRGSRADDSCKRMPDVLDFDAGVSVELLFKRKDHQHAIDVSAERADSIPAPSPHLRTDVIDDLESLAMKLASEAHIEVGPIDQDNRRGPPRARRLKQRSICAVEFSDCAGDFRHADDSDLARINQRLDSRGAHLVAAGTEYFKRDSRIEPSECLRKRSAVLIAAGFAGNDH